jgi:hypothetical protein
MILKLISDRLYVINNDKKSLVHKDSYYAFMNLASFVVNGNEKHNNLSERRDNALKTGVDISKYEKQVKIKRKPLHKIKTEAFFYTLLENENNKMFLFAEWAAYNYVRLNGVWVHKYASQTNKDFWLTTEKLYEIYTQAGGV